MFPAAAGGGGAMPGVPPFPVSGGAIPSASAPPLSSAETSPLGGIGSQFPIPLPEWLMGNPYFTAGFALGGVGIATSLLRTSTSSLQSVLRRQLVMSLEIPSKDYAYQWVMQFLVNQRVHSARHLGIETTYSKDVSGRQHVAFDFVPSPGRHWIRYKGTFIKMERERQIKTVDMSTGSPWETLTLTTLAWRPHLFAELLEEAKLAALAREEGKTIIYKDRGPEWQTFGTPKRIRPFDSVVLHGDAAEQIYTDVTEFLASHIWYLDRGIPYRRGYLLHGPPGCGKSSYVMALAGRLGYNICVLNLGDPGMTDDRLQHLLAVVPPRCLVLLEDIDFAVAPSTPAANSGPYAGSTRVSFSGLLNALDGVVATEERIVFMTTNHFQALPRALIRPGRIDVNAYIGLASPGQLVQMFSRFFPGEVEKAEQFAVLCEGENLSMAEVQGYFMFFKNQPDPCLANTTRYLEERRQAMSQENNAGAMPSGATIGAQQREVPPAAAAVATTPSEEEGEEAGNTSTSSSEQAAPAGVGGGPSTPEKRDGR